MIDRLKAHIVRWLLGTYTWADLPNGVTLYGLDALHARMDHEQGEVARRAAAQAAFESSLRADLALLSMKQRALAEQVQPVNPKLRAAWMKRLETRVDGFVEAHNARVTAAQGASEEKSA
jgi:hypothetical protein